MAGEVSKPHDHLFRSIFGEDREAEAAGLLQAYLPEAISRELRWSSQEEQLATIEQLVSTGVAWSTIEAATGIDEETFDRLKHQFDSADG